MTKPILSTAITRALADVMARDDQMIVIAADSPERDTSAGINSLDAADRSLFKAFGPWRVLQTEGDASLIIDAAFGAAAEGIAAVADATASPSADGAFDALCRHAAQMQNNTYGPVVIRMRLSETDILSRSAGLHAAQSGTIAVAIPATPNDAVALLDDALERRVPLVLLEHDTVDGPTDAPQADTGSPLGLGTARIVRPGSDMTVIAMGAQLGPAQRAADRLEGEHGISCEVIDPRSVAPLDLDLILGSVERTGRLSLIETGSQRCPLMSEVAARAAENCCHALIAPVTRVPGTTIEALMSGLRRAVTDDRLR